jgi:hypothetical protein
MNKFYFNDCLPQNKSKHVIQSCLEKVLPQYKSIRSKYIHDVDGIVTSKMPGCIVLNEDGFTLKNCIEGLEDRNLRKYAFAVFGKYPIENYFAVKDVEDLVEGSYNIMVDNITYDAMNLKMAHENGGLVFSLPLHRDLEKNVLLITDKNCNEYCILNLFGDDENTAHVDKNIQEQITARAGNFARLIHEVGKCFYNSQFEAAFNKVSFSVQAAIIDRFKAARNRRGPTPFYADGDMVKDVSPNKGKSIRVSELRIHRPVGYRVYFYEATDGVYLGLVQKKPADRVQSSHITTAAAVIGQLMVAG